MSPTNDSDDMEPQLAQLSWNEILYDDGLAARVTGSSFRSITIGVCLIGIIGMFWLRKKHFRSIFL